MLRAVRLGGLAWGRAAFGGRAAWAWALLVVLGLRLGLGAFMALAWAIARPYMPAAVLESIHTVSLPRYGPIIGRALEVWPRWDAMHYFAIAQRSYLGVSEGDTVFYPLYPLLLRGLAPLFGGDYLLAALLVSTLAAVAALACLYRLAEARFGGDAARWAVLALGLYPTSFFLIAPFTESLFLALTLGAFLAADSRRWWLVGLLGALASLARGPGLLTAPALAWVAWEQWRAAVPRPGLGQTLGVAAGVAGPVAGGAVFLAWRAWMGFAPMDEVLRTYSGLELVDPISGLIYAVRQFLAVHDLHTTLDVGSAALFLGLGAALARRARWRVGGWLVYLSMNLAFFFTKHSLTASSLQSLARYVLVLFPAFVVLGDWLAAQSPRTRFVYIVASSLGLLVLSALYAVGWFVG